MAELDIPRELQSEMHDMADEIGEKVAKGELIEMDGSPSFPYPQFTECICKRYSRKLHDGRIYFENVVDPDCEYIHLAPLPHRFAIHPAP